ncbi:hypothetical protein [Thioalkalivibrio sp.]|uniref:hypothetical protein n=1 Tax=Thioalkalivibrio sp. TaxID=2093813 RepID=UPI0026008F47|nr:hypothetical protein [Thioalkalivibrio sp.]
MIHNREMADVIWTLLRPLSLQNPPRIFDLRDRLQTGEHVSAPDMRYLPESVSDARLAKPAFHGNPEPARVGAKLVTLYRGMDLNALGTECSLSA